jgi:hypothetical protein
MRKMFLIKMGLLLSVCVSFAQDEWAPIGAKWFYSVTTDGPPALVMFTSIDDTLIQNKICRKFEILDIFHSQKSHWEHFIDTATSYAYFYFEDSSVFHYDKVGYFYKLYDFSISPGDTVLVRDNSFPGDFSYTRFEYVVDSISHMMISGKDFRVFHTSPTERADYSFSNFVESFPVIERIGSTGNFFGTSIYIAISSSNRFLRCYMDQDLSYRSELWNDTLSCDYFNYNLTVNPQIKPSVKVFPNPFTESLQVNLESDRYDFVRIIDLTGRIFHEAKIVSTNFTVDLSPFPEGIYILSISSSKYNFRQKILKN